MFMIYNQGFPFYILLKTNYLKIEGLYALSRTDVREHITSVKTSTIYMDFYISQQFLKIKSKKKLINICFLHEIMPVFKWLMYIR